MKLFILETKSANAFNYCWVSILSVVIFTFTWSFIFWGVQRHFEVGAGTDVEHDYVGNAIAIVEGQHPITYRHPGTPLYYLLAFFLKDTPLELQNIQNTLERLYLCGLILSILSIFLFFREAKDILRTNLVGCCLVPCSFLLPATTWYMQIYSGEMVTFAWVLLIVSLAIPILNSENDLSIGKLIVWGLVLGAGCAVRFAFLPLVIAAFVSIIFRGFFQKPQKTFSLDFYFIALLLTLLVTIIAGFSEIPYKYFKYRILFLASLLFFNIAMLCAPLFFKRMRYLMIILTILLNSVLLGYLMCVGRHFLRTLYYFYCEMHLIPQTIGGKIHQLSSGCRMVFACAPIFGGISFILLVFSATIIWKHTSDGKEKNEKLNLSTMGLLVFLLVSSSLVFFGGLSHPYIGTKIVPYGVPMRMILIAAPLVSVLAIISPIFMSLKIVNRVRYFAVFIIISGLYMGFVSINQMYQMTMFDKKNTMQIEAIIKNFEVNYNRRPNILFYGALYYSPAALHYAIRQYGHLAGIEKFRKNYPNVWDENLPPELFKKEFNREVAFAKYDLFITTELHDFTYLENLGTVNTSPEGLIWVLLSH